MDYLDLPFWIVIVHQDHREGNTEHHHATDNDLLFVIVFALDVSRIFFVEFLERRTFGKSCRIHAENPFLLFIGHVQRADVGTVRAVHFRKG